MATTSAPLACATSAWLLVGCSLADFDYLSAGLGKASGGAAGASSAGDGGSGAGGMPGGAATTGGAGSSGAGGSVEAPWFCADAGGAENVGLPATGNYLIHKTGTDSGCLVTPNWLELENKAYYAVMQDDCGAPQSASPPLPDQVWYFEHLCKNMYRVTSHHDTAEERQLGVLDETLIGSPLHSIPSTRSDQPNYIFQVRVVSDQAPEARVLLAPLSVSNTCAEQAGDAHYGQLDVHRVVVYACDAKVALQSWDLFSVP